MCQALRQLLTCISGPPPLTSMAVSQVTMLIADRKDGQRQQCFLEEEASLPNPDTHRTEGLPFDSVGSGLEFHQTDFQGQTLFPGATLYSSKRQMLVTVQAYSKLEAPY